MGAVFMGVDGGIGLQDKSLFSLNSHNHQTE